MVNAYHTPVLAHDALEFLITTPDGVYVDATVGGGGHADAVLRTISSRGRVIGFDVDADALMHATKRLESFRDRVVLVRANYSQLREELSRMGIAAVDGILFDLGVSSFQLDEPRRGFSFREDEPLDMRMDDRQKTDARLLLARIDGDELAQLFQEYGEVPQARRIARAVVAQRKKKAIESTGDFTSIVSSVVGARPKSLARIFQALRIAVNDELTHLRSALQQTLNLLSPGGRIVVISYHSLEDRIVKDFFRAEAAERTLPRTKLEPVIRRVPTVRILTKKPAVPSPTEIRLNRRARSAKLRAAERL